MLLDDRRHVDWHGISRCVIENPRVLPCHVFEKCLFGSFFRFKHLSHEPKVYSCRTILSGVLLAFYFHHRYLTGFCDDRQLGDRELDEIILFRLMSREESSSLFL